MRKNIEELITSVINANKVSVETGIPRNTVYRIFSGEASIDNITLRNAEILSNYWEENKMEKVEKELYNDLEVVFENGGTALFSTGGSAVECKLFVVDNEEDVTGNGIVITYLKGTFTVEGITFNGVYALYRDSEYSKKYFDDGDYLHTQAYYLLKV